MKEKAKNTNGKNHMLSPMRVSEEIMAKLEYLQEQTKKPLSTIRRELIENGYVEFNPHGKELIKDVAELHKKANQYTAQVRDDIQSVKNDIEQLRSYIHDNKIENEQISIFLTTAAYSKLDFIEKHHAELITICRRVHHREDDK